MSDFISLDDYLATWAGSDSGRKDIAETIKGIIRAGMKIGDLIADGPLEGALADVVGEEGGGDAQKELDVISHDLVIEELRNAPVAVIGSEEAKDPVILDPSKPLAVATDPLDGSSNIDTNVSIGTIFGILPLSEAGGDPLEALLLPGSKQVAAGYIVYGPQTAIVLTMGEGTLGFTLDRRSNTFKLTAPAMKIPSGKREFAINASNYRFWDEPIQMYIDDLVAGEEGPRENNFNMRWVASLVAEAYRIFVRGGVFLYPRDNRKGYGKGRLRLVYEANPIAMLAEQAGGGATTGQERILDIKPTELHERTALIFGAKDKVSMIERYHLEPHSLGERSPLFGKRGLFRT